MCHFDPLSQPVASSYKGRPAIPLPPHALLTARTMGLVKVPWFRRGRGGLCGRKPLRSDQARPNYEVLKLERDVGQVADFSMPSAPLCPLASVQATR